LTRCLLGRDLYSAHTFIAVPSLVVGVGAVGFFAVPYTIIVFPIVFVFAPRLWSVSRVHSYITPADFVRGRYGSQGLALAVAVTGILATMPYIALQLVGIQAVLTVLGVGGDRRAGLTPPQRHPPQHGAPARVLADARVRRSAGLHGARGTRRAPGRQGQRRQRPVGRAVPVPEDVPALVHGHRPLGHRHRRAGPGGDHVDRGREP